MIEGVQNMRICFSVLAMFLLAWMIRRSMILIFISQEVSLSRVIINNYRPFKTCSFLQVSRHERRASQLQALNEMPLYPTEDIIWNENIVPSEYFSGEGCLALPKLNLQFLTLHDYLLRNFNLFRLESTCMYQNILYSSHHFIILFWREWKVVSPFWLPPSKTTALSLFNYTSSSVREAWNY
jgi:hypothetical protein